MSSTVKLRWLRTTGEMEGFFRYLPDMESLVFPPSQVTTRSEARMYYNWWREDPADFRVLLAYEEETGQTAGMVYGCVEGTNNPDVNRMDIMGVFVRPPFRNRGLSFAMVETALIDCYVRGLHVVIQTIESNKAMLATLDKCKAEGLLYRKQKTGNPVDYYGDGRMLRFIQYLGKPRKGMTVWERGNPAPKRQASR